MHLVCRNVNAAFRGLIEGIHSGLIPTQREESRVGTVLRIEEPLIVTYTSPGERVLFNSARDCNVFFHVFEGLWMLAGRNDLESLAYYNSRMAEFSDDGVTLNGAYGHRWRHYYSSSGDLYDEVDQLSILINQIKSDPSTRRAVLQMWGVADDLLKPNSLDLCCNLSVVFGVSAGRLNMTVFNRSNDVVWGMLGANVVHFSLLHEYVSCCVGIPMGVYNQISVNAHVYTERWEPEKWLADETPDYYTNARVNDARSWGRDFSKTFPLVQSPEVFDEECAKFVDKIDGVWAEPFLRRVAMPMCQAFRHHKNREYAAAMETINYVEADDWRIAGTAWLEARKQKWELRLENANPYVVRENMRRAEASTQED